MTRPFRKDQRQLFCHVVNNAAMNVARSDADGTFVTFDLRSVILKHSKANVGTVMIPINTLWILYSVSEENKDWWFQMKSTFIK